MSQSKPANPHTRHKQFWAIVPAAGVGTRMQADRPKQYLSLFGKTLLEHSLQRLLNVSAICGVVVAVDTKDSSWSDLNFKHHKPVLTVAGGTERCHSVLNALNTLTDHLKQATTTDDIWVLVHDAARPCVRNDDLELLIASASDDDHGGLLALPVRDTMKRQTAEGRTETTIDRNGLWHAMTPQMFRLSLLSSALNNALEKKLHVTDDASAMELMGYQPRLVACHEDNIKVTRPFDLTLANLYMQQQSASPL